MADLFTATAPTEPGYYWWRLDRNAMPLPAVIDLGASTFYVLCGDRWQDHIYGLWGPRIPLPIAPPVECWAVTTDRGHGNEIASSAWRDLGTAKECLRISGEWHGLVSGVFVPTAIVETNDAQ